MKTHGYTAGGRITPEYRTWQAIIRRCEDLKFPHRKDYGGRGIRMCKRWRNSFADFLADMGPRPKGTTIERIDNDGNYEPGNCRWATKHDQARNRRDNVFITHDGETKILADWAAHYGVSADIISYRMTVQGTSFKEAISRPIRKSEIAHNGEVKSIAGWARHYGISRHVLRDRMVNLGLSIDDAVAKPTRKSPIQHTRRKLA